MNTLKNIYLRNRYILWYGTLMALLLLLLKWLQWKFLITDQAEEVYTGFIALFFTVLGIWLAFRLRSPEVRTVIVEKEIPVPLTADAGINETELQKLNLSSREYEVLQCMSRGLSNAEIAAELFLSVSTIKTHASNLFVKMDVKSRTQAIEKSKRLRITP
ncbi:MAG: response regulator transcription factor [Bacteroidia bacterium]|nr:response regulator transcription factor [Bacteroidia bacterium]